MPGLRNKLKAASLKSISTPGKHADGGGLYLQVTKHPVAGNLRKSWIVRYRAATGKMREMGIGSFEDVSLANAREKAERIRYEVRDGNDAVEVRAEAKQEVIRSRAASMTFAQCAEAYVNAHQSTWKNEKHRAQWTSSLQTYAYPVFAEVAIQDINISMVMKVLDPIWETKTETASRVSGRIENIIDWATVREYRTGENPARWRGHLEKALPARNKTKKVKHFAALAIDDFPKFMKHLRVLIVAEK